MGQLKHCYATALHMLTNNSDRSQSSSLAIIY